MSEESKQTLSFGFSKTINSRKLQTSSLNEENGESKEEADFITAVDKKELQSVRPKEETKELVIPCIVKNTWRKPAAEKEDGLRQRIEGKATGPEGGDLVSQAVTELLADARRQQEVWDDVGKAEDQNIAIPILVQNKLPEGYETDDKLDVSLRPDEAAAADYEQIPIEQYGLAMLRGMGWKPGQGVGRSKKEFKPVESVLRPKGLGLGADKSQALQHTYSQSGSKSKTTDNEELILKKGACCMILKGAHRDLYGKIEGLDDDNARVMVKLGIGGKTVTQSQYGIKLVTAQEYDKFSKYLNKGKVDKYKEKEEKKHKGSNERARDEQKRQKNGHDQRSETESKKSRYRDRSPFSDRDKSDKKSKKTFGSESKSDSESSVSVSNGRIHKLWLRPQIKVRIIDKHFKKGRFYNSKVVIVDVLDANSCIVKTEDGVVLEGVCQSMLETVVPKSDPAYALVVSGKYSGHIVQVMNRNKKLCKATVQLLQDRDTAIELDYDRICEYAGDIDNVFDY